MSNAMQCTMQCSEELVSWSWNCVHLWSGTAVSYLDKFVPICTRYQVKIEGHFGCECWLIWLTVSP